MYTYEELRQQKDKGAKLDWENITLEQLHFLYVEEDILNRQIADLYDVTPSQVSAKRQKWRILFDEKANKSFYKNLFNEKNIDMLAKAITEYAFRSGPIEDMHSAGQLKQSDMKDLNKYMVNRLAGLMKMIANSEWVKIDKVMSFYARLAYGWDAAEPDTKDFDQHSRDDNEW